MNFIWHTDEETPKPLSQIVVAFTYTDNEKYNGMMHYDCQTAEMYDFTRAHKKVLGWAYVDTAEVERRLIEYRQMDNEQFKAKKQRIEEIQSKVAELKKEQQELIDSLW